MTVILPFARTCSRQSTCRAAVIFKASNGVSRVAISSNNCHRVSQNHNWSFQDTFTAPLTRFYATETNTTSGEATTRPGKPKAHTGRAKASKPKSSTAKASASSSRAKGTVAKKPTAKRTASKKPKRKTKAKSKAKPKPKPRRRPSEKQKEKAAKQKIVARRKQLRSDALLSSEPKKKANSAWQLIVAEISKKSSGSGSSANSKDASATYRNLSPEDRERYNHAANQNRAQNEADRQKWQQSLSPEQIRVANQARAALRRLKKQSTGRKTVASPYAITDERIVKRPQLPYNCFHLERYRSGDFAGMSVPEAAKLIGVEWKKLSDNEKKVYSNKSSEDINRYRTEYKTVYGHDPPVRAARAARAA